MLDIVAKQLVEYKTKDYIKIFKSLSVFDKFCLNKFYNMNFETIETMSDKDLWFNAIGHKYIDIMLNNGINVNIQSYYGNTALMVASRHNITDVVNFLLQQPNINVNVVNHSYETALDLATTNEMRELLKKHGGVTALYLMLKSQNLIAKSC